MRNCQVRPCTLPHDETHAPRAKGSYLQTGNNTAGWIRRQSWQPGTCAAGVFSQTTAVHVLAHQSHPFDRSFLNMNPAATAAAAKAPITSKLLWPCCCAGGACSMGTAMDTCRSLLEVVVLLASCLSACCMFRRDAGHMASERFVLRGSASGWPRGCG